jgi:putative SOS response-associated peptidase YedK
MCGRYASFLPAEAIEMAELHDRMPVILEQADWPVWLGELEGDHAALLRPASDGLLRVWPVDRRVGSPRNNAPELLASIVT